MEPERLAAELVQRTQAIVPPQVHLVVRGDTVTMEADDRLYAPGGSVRCSIGDWLALEPDDEAAALERACEAFLDNVQDYVAETIGEPWPARSGRMPVPWVHVADEHIELGYRLDQAPVVAMAPVSRR